MVRTRTRLIGPTTESANSSAVDTPIAQVSIPDTAVYARNIAAIDRFLGLVPRVLGGGDELRSEDVADRFGPLNKKLDALFEASRIRTKQKRVLATERWWNRNYTTAAYCFGRPAPRRNKTALLLTAGIHGDEAGGVLGMADVMSKIDPDLLAHFEPIVIVPCVHPATLDLGVRELIDGRDPNRLFYTDDPTRPATIRALEALASELTEGGDAMLIDLHQDDRFDTNAVYALYGNDRSRTIATAAIGGATNAGQAAVREPIDGAANVDGALEKSYAGSFSVPPGAASRTNPPVEVVLEINDAAAFWPAVAAAIERFKQTSTRAEP